MNRIINNNQIELAVLAVRGGAAICKVAGTCEKIMLRMSSFERMLWLNPTDNQGVRFIIYPVRDKKPWSNKY